MLHACLPGQKVSPEAAADALCNQQPLNRYAPELLAQRALQALHGIASHPVNLDFATAAAAPIASRQLAQAWQAFQAAVTRSSLPDVGPKSTAGVLISDAAAASSAAAAGALVPDAVAASSAAAAAVPLGDVTGAKHGRPGMGQQAHAADDPEDEEVSTSSKRHLAHFLCFASSYQLLEVHCFSTLASCCVHRRYSNVS